MVASVGRILTMYVWLARPRDNVMRSIPDFLVTTSKVNKQTPNVIKEGREFIQCWSMSKPSIEGWRKKGWDVYDLHQERVTPEDKDKKKA